MIQTFANAAIIISATMSLVFGILYLTKNKFLNHHRVTIEKDWEELSSHTQILILALMKSLGGGLISVSITIFFLQYQLQRLQQSWIALLILICGTITTMAILHAQLSVIRKTKGRPPIFATICVLALLIIGYILNLASLRNYG